MARRLRRERATVLQAHLPVGSAVGLPAARLARTPLAIHTAHHSHELPYHGPKLRLFERVTAGMLANVVVAPSEAVRAPLEAAGVPGAKIEVIHHGFELGRFAADVDRDAVRAEFGAAPGDTLLGTVGRDFPLKNNEALIAAHEALLAEHPELRLAFVVRGPSDGLRERIARSPAAGRIALLADRSDVPALLRGFDLYVHPARAESFGMVIVEALAAGLPVLATPVGIAPEAVDATCGWITASAGERDVEAGLRTALAERDRWGALGDGARAAAGAFPVARMVAAHEALYATAGA
jgi:glycosyltransferase involved in cell wall biosynthesis